MMALILNPGEVVYDSLEVVLPPRTSVRVETGGLVPLDTVYRTVSLPEGLRKRIPDWLRERLEWNLTEILKVPVKGKSSLYPSKGDLDGDGIADLVLGFGDGVVRFYRGPDYVPFDSLKLGEGALYPSAAESGSGLLLLGDGDGWLRLYDLGEKKEIAVIRLSDGSIYPAFYRGVFYVGSEKGNIYIVRAKGKKLKKKLIYRGDGPFTPVLWGDSLYFKGKEGLYSLEKGRMNLKERLSFEGFPLFIDADGDGREDLVTAHEGRLGYFRDIDGGYLIPDTSYRLLFPRGFPLAAAPAPLSPESLIVGSDDGSLYLVHPGEDTSCSLLFRGPRYPVPKVVDYDGDGDPDLLLGSMEGLILLFRDLDSSRAETLSLRADSYSAPCLFGGEVMTGSIDGKLYTAEGAFRDIDVGSSSVPDVGDINGDGREDLVVGDQEGRIHFFLSPSYEEDSALALYVGEMAAPRLLDLNRDGLLDLLAGNLDGRIYYFENVGSPADPVFVERYSWRFRPEYGTESLQRYYENYMPRLFPFLVPADSSSLRKCIELIENCGNKIVDEVAFSIAYTPSEVIRAMARMDELELLSENASLVYKVAEKVKYAEIREYPDYTTIVYDGKYELPRDYYYFFVVHPRILYEIPAYVDASFWDRPPDYYGLSEDEWLRKEVNVYKNREKGLFWRSFFLKDRKYGKSVLEAVEDADSLWEAVFSVYMLQMYNKENPVMRFGYKTQDLQPIVIYKKAYGSCGEQSILYAALARTALIPVYVVTDRGEDHQWNEYWDRDSWHHIDINWKPEKAIDNPYTSSEGMKGKTVSCVTGWRGDDVMFDVTARGYTDTAVVRIRVLDSRGRPVDGAIVIPRSHWLHRNSIANWKYTDTEGRVTFGLGYQPLGYTFEVLSPFGIAGSENVFIKEGRTYRYSYSLPDSLPVSHFQGGSLPEYYRIQTLKSWQVLRNFVTGKPYRIRNIWLRDTVGYEGTRRFINPLLDTTSPLVALSGDTLSLYNPSLLTYRKVLITKRIEGKSEPPIVRVLAHPDSLRMGETGEFRLIARDNLRLRSLFFSYDGGENYCRIKVPEGETLIFRWETGAGGPLLPGTYRILFKAVDFAGNEAVTDPIEVRILPTRDFIGQKVYQDDPESDKPSASWIYGPIEVPDGMRYLLIWTEAPGAEGLDLDLFLCYDKNGNGFVDDKKEILKKSTSPFNTERIYVAFPKPGLYWIYAQGCTVRDEPSLFNLHTSFVVDEKGRAIK